MQPQADLEPHDLVEFAPRYRSGSAQLVSRGRLVAVDFRSQMALVRVAPGVVLQMFVTQVVRVKPGTVAQ